MNSQIFLARGRLEEQEKIFRQVFLMGGWLPDVRRFLFQGEELFWIPFECGDAFEEFRQALVEHLESPLENVGYGRRSV